MKIYTNCWKYNFIRILLTLKKKINKTSNEKIVELSSDSIEINNYINN